MRTLQLSWLVSFRALKLKNICQELVVPLRGENKKISKMEVYCCKIIFVDVFWPIFLKMRTKQDQRKCF